MEVLKICPICQEPCTSNFSTIYQKGADSINEASKLRKDNIRVTPGVHVHVTCRKNYTKIPTTSHTDSEIRKTRSSSGVFILKEYCFLCGFQITPREKITGKAFSVKCRNREVDKSIQKAIINRQNDDWATEVQGRLAIIMALRAEGAVYHTQCDSNFRTGKSNPMKITAKKRGRPPCMDREAAFLEIINHIEAN